MAAVEDGWPNAFRAQLKASACGLALSWGEREAEESEEAYIGTPFMISCKRCTSSVAFVVGISRFMDVKAVAGLDASTSGCLSPYSYVHDRAAVVASVFLRRANMANKAMNSGDGTRPTTDGAVDNIGGGERFDAGRSRVGGDNSSPAPRERMDDKRANVASTLEDDSAAFGLRPDLKPTPNGEGKKP
jgi:hypothetical protein